MPRPPARIGHVGLVFALALSLLLAGALQPGTVGARACVVTTLADGNPAPAGSLRRHVNDAGCDSITFTVTGTITLTAGGLTIARNLTITGPGASSLRISGNDGSRVFNITRGTVAISGLTITGGRSESDNGDGGGVYNAGTLTLTGTTISGNRARTFSEYGPHGYGWANFIYGGNGGGVYNAGTLTLTGTTISDNIADPYNGAMREPLPFVFRSSGGHGGGVHNAGTLTLTGTTISDNIAAPTAEEFHDLSPDFYGGAGGGIYSSGTLTVQTSSISDNLSKAWIFYNRFNPREDVLGNYESTFRGGEGGGIFNSGKLAVTDTTISGNRAIGDTGTEPGSSASAGGGGLYSDSSVAATLEHVTISGNAACFGGGVANRGVLTLMDAAISGNSVEGRGIFVYTKLGVATGGGVYNDGTLTITTSTISGNDSLAFGSGLASDYPGRLTLTDTTVSGNGSSLGGGLYINSPATVTNSIVSGNTANGGGGIFVNFAGDLTLDTSTVSGNTALSGGGIDVRGHAAVTNSVVSGNTANGSTGGGVYLAIFFNSLPSLVLTNSTISGNTAAGSDGGGLYIEAGTAALTNTTVSGNTAVQGGGLYVGYDDYRTRTTYYGNAILANSTISDNTATTGGSLYVDRGTATLTNTIVAGSDASNCYGSVGNGGHNLDDGASCGFAVANGSRSGVDPLLAPLGSYGGPTQTHALRPGSPAIDLVPATGASCPIADQRGVARPQGAACDGGALESRGFTLSLISGSDQTGLLHAPFPAPLVVGVTPAAGEPVAGGVLTFSGPGGGAGIANAPLTATIGANGEASVTPAANGTAGGPYTVEATTRGAAGTVNFSLTNTTMLTPALTVAVGGGGKVGRSPAGSGNNPFAYPLGTVVTLTATPDPGQAFVGWTVDGAAAGSANPLTVTMLANHTVQATFAPAPAPSPSPSPSASPAFALTVAAQGPGGVSPRSGSHPAGAVVGLAATPNSGAVFVGWLVDGVPTGWANPIALTMDTPHDVVATFAAAPAFADVPGSRPDAAAIAALVGRGIAQGYAGDGFGPDDPLQRAQLAAFVARAMPGGGALAPPACLVAGTWDCEDWGNAFTDRGGLDPNLWRNVGTLAHYGVAQGYGDGTFAPTDPVTSAQTLALIARAMVAKGYWLPQPGTGAPAGVPAAHAGDVATFLHYAGGVPAPGDWNAGATRGWCAWALWAALDSYWAVDRVP